MKVSAEGKTDRGLVREGNEDDLCVAPADGLFAVADGLGGAVSGEVASRMALGVLREYIGKTSPGGDALKKAVGGIGLANRVLYEASRKDPSLLGMGTTIASVIIDGDKMAVAHVGDSRVYLIRTGVITQLTEDHSVVAEQVRAGLLTNAEAASSGMRNIITRALGQEDDVDIDTSKISLMGGDRVLLCTDGLTTMVPDESILSTVLSHKDPGDACRALVDLANERGGEDNITVVLLYLEQDTVSNIVKRFLGMKRR